MIDPYAEIADAVAWHERADIVELWEVIRGSNFSPGDVQRKLIQIADKTLKHVPGGMLAKARPQMDHPLFLRYVAGKLGAV